MGNICSVSISTEDTISRCWDCILGQASYTCKLKNNCKALSLELEKLKARRDDVNRRVELAETQLMRRFRVVDLWLRRAGTLITEVERLIIYAQEFENLGCGGCFSWNCMSSHKYGRQVAKKLQEIGGLWSEGDFNTVADYEAAWQVEGIPIEDPVGLVSTCLQLRSLLENKNVGIIGLHGLGGVGKTTLLTCINNMLSDLSVTYDIVIWVVVSKDHTIENVQKKILEKISPRNQSWENKRSEDNAQDIFKILNKKKFVLLLDDVWERVDLTKVGIPLPSVENECKVIFTTRLSHICGEMEAKVKMEVKTLGKDEAWTLFKQKVGEETLNSNPNIRELGKSVAEECDGLPLALVVIGRAMTGKKSPKSWEFAIEVLRNTAHKFPKTGQELYPILKFSFDNLPSDIMRNCLLYFCLFPEDFPISKSSLIEYWFCEGLLTAFESISKARLEGYDIIDSLLSANLLEQDDDVDYVKMHDVIRDMVLWIACECEATEKRYFVGAGLQLTESPEVGKWEAVRRMSLMQNQIRFLRSTPTCPNLQTLFLNCNDLRDICDGFFQFMPSLTVLNLSNNRHLTKVSEGISRLVSLECLDLSRTGITELPNNLKSLVKLKFIDLSCIVDLQKIPRQLISTFSKLQVFKIDGSGIWKSPNESNVGEDNVLIGDNEGLVEELGSLQHLDSVSIEIKSGFALQKLLSFHNLHGCTEDLRLCNFKESKELNVLCLASMKRLERLDVRECEDMEEIKGVIQTSFSPVNNRDNRCFHMLHHVEIFECDKLKDLTWLILAPSLTTVLIVNCRKIEDIMSEEKLSEVADLVEIANPTPFQKLQQLILQYLPELKSICWKALPFPSLAIIKVLDCSKLKQLPLNSGCSNRINLSIEGFEEWWEALEWEDEDTRNGFSPCFRSWKFN